MKNYFFVLFFFISNMFFCQNKIQGLGIFKVGITKLNTIDSLSTSGYNIEKCNDYIFNCQMAKSGKRIIVPTEKDKIYLPEIEEKKTFFIEGYEVSNLTISNIQLDFYKNILYSVKVKDIKKDLSDAIDSKYKSEISKKEKEITCSSIYGNYDRTETTYYQTFRNDDVYAEKVLSIYYNSKCEKNSLHYLIIRNKKIDDLVRSVEIKKHDEDKLIKQEKDKQTYKDL